MSLSALHSELRGVPSSAPQYEIGWRDAIKQTVASCIVHSMTIQGGVNISYSSILLPQLETDESEIPIVESEKTWIASILTLSLPIGSIIAGPLMDRFGRKLVCIVTAIPFLLAWIVQACATEVQHIYVARLLAGLGGGLTTAATVYVSEIAHHDYRPMLLSLSSVFTNFGILLTYVMGLVMGWRIMAIIFCIMTAGSLILTLFIPQSPHWLLSFREDNNESMKAVRWLYNESTLFERQYYMLQSKKSRLVVRKPNSAKGTAWDTVKGSLEVYRRRMVVKPVITLFVLFLFQQLSGGYVIIFYAVDLFDKLAGDFEPSMDDYVALVLLGSIRFAVSFISAMLSKKIGRRPLLLVSALGMGISSLVCGLYLYGTRTRRHHNPNLALACVLTYVCFSALGFLVIPWTLIGELLPLKVRAMLSGLLVAVAYLLMFGVVKGFLFVLNSFEIYSIFFAIALVNFVAMGFVYLWIPETFKKTLAEIEDYYEKSC